MRRSPIVGVPDTAPEMRELIVFEPYWTDQTMSGENSVPMPEATNKDELILAGDVAVDLVNLDIYQFNRDGEWDRRRLSDFSPDSKRKLQHRDPGLFNELIEKERE